MKFTAPIKVWLSSNYFDPRTAGTFIEEGREAALATKFNYTNTDMSGTDGWSEVGMAEVTVTLFDDHVLVEKKVEALRSEIQLTRATTQQKITKLEEQLQNLLSLPNLEN